MGNDCVVYFGALFLQVSERELKVPLEAAKLHNCSQESHWRCQVSNVSNYRHIQEPEMGIQSSVEGCGYGNGFILTVCREIATITGRLIAHSIALLRIDLGVL